MSKAILNFCAMNPTIGTRIETTLVEKGMTVAEFSRRINRSPQTCYDIFKRESIDTELLATIGGVLDHNFFQYFMETKEPASAPNPRPYRVTIMLEMLDAGEADRVLRIALGDKAFNQLKK